MGGVRGKRRCSSVCPLLSLISTIMSCIPCELAFKCCEPRYGKPVRRSIALTQPHFHFPKPAKPAVNPIGSPVAGNTIVVEMAASGRAVMLRSMFLIKRLVVLAEPGKPNPIALARHGALCQKKLRFGVYTLNPKWQALLLGPVAQFQNKDGPPSYVL